MQPTCDCLIDRSHQMHDFLFHPSPPFVAVCCLVARRKTHTPCLWVLHVAWRHAFVFLPRGEGVGEGLHLRTSLSSSLASIYFCGSCVALKKHICARPVCVASLSAGTRGVEEETQRVFFTCATKRCSPLRCCNDTRTHTHTHAAETHVALLWLHHFVLFCTARAACEAPFAHTTPHGGTTTPFLPLFSFAAFIFPLASRHDSPFSSFISFFFFGRTILCETRI